MSIFDYLMHEEEEVGLAVAWGEVTQVSPLQVKLAGDTTSTDIPRRLSNYTATLNDRVILIKVGNIWVILGKLV